MKPRLPRAAFRHGLPGLVLALAACTPAIYSAHADMELAPTVLDAQTPIREFWIRACVDEEAEVLEASFEFEAWSTSPDYRQGDALLGFTEDDLLVTHQVDEDGPRGDPAMLVVDGDAQVLDELCEQGRYVTFELADLESSDAVEIQWTVDFRARSYDDAIEAAQVTLTVVEVL